MKKRATWITVSLLLCALCACRRETSAAAATSSGATATMAPVSAPPAPPGTDSMTQTVDVEDSRSEGESGGVTEPDPATTTAAKPAPVGVKASPKAPAKKKH